MGKCCHLVVSSRHAGHTLAVHETQNEYNVTIIIIIIINMVKRCLPPPPYLRQLLADSLIVLSTSGVEPDGAARVHLAERHLLRRGAMKRLDEKKKKHNKKNIHQAGRAE